MYPLMNLTLPSFDNKENQMKKLWELKYTLTVFALKIMTQPLGRYKVMLSTRNIKGRLFQ